MVQPPSPIQSIIRKFDAILTIYECPISDYSINTPQYTLNEECSTENDYIPIFIPSVINTINNS